MKLLGKRHLRRRMYLALPPVLCLAGHVAASSAVCAILFRCDLKRGG